jgi:Zn-finger nucleic acid-binding protein
MATCTHCSAPLPANNNVCKYCGSRNDVDLHAKYTYSVAKMVSERICPHCDIPLQTIRLNLAEPCFIERCSKCYGLFFDPGEVESILESSVSNVFTINRHHLDNINKDRYRKNPSIRYVKCPQCRMLMNRINFGRRSGVVVDQCIKHGIWLDNGELVHLLEWKKAGGQLLQRKIEEDRIRSKSKPSLPHSADNYRIGSRNTDNGLEYQLLETIAKVIFKLFT